MIALLGWNMLQLIAIQLTIFQFWLTVRILLPYTCVTTECINRRFRWTHLLLPAVSPWPRSEAILLHQFHTHINSIYMRDNRMYKQKVSLNSPIITRCLSMTTLWGNPASPVSYAYFSRSSNCVLSCDINSFCLTLCANIFSSKSSPPYKWHRVTTTAHSSHSHIYSNKHNRINIQ